MKITPSTLRGSKLKLFLAGASLLLFCLLLPLPLSFALASEVIIVKDAEIKPYREAIEGFKSTCNCSTREFDLGDLDELERAIKSSPDAVLAVGTRAFRRLKPIENVPLIYTMVMPSETIDLKENVSGICMDISPETYLNTMAELFPTVKSVGVLFDPEHTGPFVQAAEAAAAKKGITLVVKKIHDPRQAPARLEQLQGKVDLLWMLPDATLISSETVDYLMLFSFRNNMPLFSFSRKYVEKGAAAALIIEPRDMGAQAGEIARGLMQGGKSPRRTFARAPRLVVNRKIGAKIGVRINDERVRDAEKVE